MIVFSSLARVPAEPVPHWSDEQVDAVIPHLDRPFNDRTVLRAMARLALHLGPRLAEYEFVAGEGESARWPADVFTLLIDNARRSSGRSAVHTANIDGNHGERYGIPNNDLRPALAAQQAASDRALLLTDYVFEGNSLGAAYYYLGWFRPLGNIDLATVAISDFGEQRAKRYGWIHPESSFTFVPQTHGRVDDALTGQKFRDAIVLNQYATNTAIVAVALQSMLDYARTLEGRQAPALAVSL